MTYLAKPRLHHPSLAPNELGYTRRDYEGKISTLCAGCGHDSISAAIIQACYELNIEPHRVAKLSGIGCSSKTPDYFLGASHGFNTVHGRMPSVLTGANLTKGQFSAAADQGSKSKKGVVNSDSPIDLVGMALQLGATFVGRSFSGDKAQLVPLIRAAMGHGGAAFLDVISPCVAFNNHAGSTKSYDYVRDHNEAVSRIDFIKTRDEITTQYAPGSIVDGEQHDGKFLRLRKLKADYDPTDRLQAMNQVQIHKARGEVLTGLLYLDADATDLHAAINTTAVPLNSLDTHQLCPGATALAKLNASLR